jgi:hypothetical protein
MAPRGQRTQRLLERLKRDWEIELIALPPETFAETGALDRQVWWRRLAATCVSMTMLDKWEPWSFHRLRRWRPEVDAALLMAWPWSPVTYAARRLDRAGIPYAVDAGDPWVLTFPAGTTRSIAWLRARRAERSIWNRATGAVITTGLQRDALKELFPGLPILVRPNGYGPVPEGSRVGRPASRDPEHLRLVHYGALSELRVDVTDLLSALVQSRRWRSISFTQFGGDHVGMLRRAPTEVKIERHAMQPWPEVLAGASRYDLAIVVGNSLVGQLPSKAIQYMTLPIRRLALTTGTEDALATYLRGRPGWLTIGNGDSDAARRIWEHVGRGWSAEELAPPADEAWPVVADQVAHFITDSLADSGPRPVERDREVRVADRSA